MVRFESKNYLKIEEGKNTIDKPPGTQRKHTDKV